SCEITEQKTRDLIWRHFPAAFIDEKDDSDYNEIKDKLFFPALPELPRMPHSSLEEKLASKKISIRKPFILNAANYPVSMLPFATVYMSADKAGNIDDVCFDFSEDGTECRMTWSEDGVENTIVCGMDGKARNSKIHLAGIDFTARCSAAWQNEMTLNVWFRPLESVCQRKWKFIFYKDGNVDAIPASKPEMRTLLEWLADSMSDFIPSAAISNIAQKAVMQFTGILEPVHKGFLKDR
ncbi:MAG: hypothetical protein K6F09_06120, partial [Clostridiales bacterium]|nr:hypothetical protein [Clostridiales bacterium]